MDRRTFLAGALTLPWLGALTACNPRRSPDLSIYLLENSVPLRLIKRFRQQQSAAKIAFTQEKSLATLFHQLQKWQGGPEAAAATPSPEPSPQTSEPSTRSSPRYAHWLTLADSWLAPAIQQSLLQPLQGKSLENLKSLAPPWTQLVQRDSRGLATSDGSFWGVPYRWGSLLLVYNQQPFEQWGWYPESWSDLLKPELQGKILLPDQEQLLFGIALKALGKSANDVSAFETPEFTRFLKQLNQQVKGYSSDHYLEPLVLNDAVLAVGWSTDILPFLQQYHQFAAAAPQEGTLLTADLWVQPQGLTSASPSTVDQAWIDYCLQPEVAVEITISSQGASPRFWPNSTISTAALPDTLSHRDLLLLNPELIQRSEFLFPVEATTQEAMTRIWKTL
jgi:putative spermidine/putrescine transport system substrate-binding protein